MVKKTWRKQAQTVLNIGPCRYCKKQMTNDESFVAFHVGEPKFAHYQCMKEDDNQRALDKTFE